MILKKQQTYNDGIIKPLRYIPNSIVNTLNLKKNKNTQNVTDVIMNKRIIKKHALLKKTILFLSKKNKDPMYTDI